ncbi:MAG: cell division protein FtsQ/DivIB [Clostridia bacterium]
MAKKAKETTLDFFYLGADKEDPKAAKAKEKRMKKEEKEALARAEKKKKQKKKKKQTQNGQDEKFDFDNEIVIGVTRIPEEQSQKPSKNKNESQNSKRKQKKKNNNKNKNQKVNRNQKIEEKKNNSKKDKQLNQESEEIKRNKKKNKKIAPKKNKRNLTEKDKKKILRRKIFLFILKWTVLIALLIGSIIFVMLTPAFNVLTINVSGNEKITTEEIISLSGLKLNENTYKMSVNRAKDAIKENPYIAKVEVKRRLPSTINIEVVERKENFMLEFVNSYVYINNQGYILKIANEKIDKPIIKGYTTPAEDIKEGNRLNNEDLARLEKVLMIVETANSNGIGELLTKIDISNKEDYLMIFDEKQKIAHIGDCSNLSTRMLYVKAILGKEEGHAGQIFVNGNLEKDKVYFREDV